MSKNRAIKSILIATVVTSTFILAYQNCSQIADQAVFPSQKPLGEGAPFPYDVDVDTFGYLSCDLNHQNEEPYTYFHFRVAANQSGGLFLRNEFNNYVNENRYSISQTEQIFQNNNIYSGATLQVSARYGQALLGVPYGVDPDIRRRVQQIFSSALSDSPLSTELASLSGDEKIRYSGGERLIGQVSVLSREAQTIRDDFVVGSSSASSAAVVLGFHGAFYTNEEEKLHKLISLRDVKGSGAYPTVYGKAIKAKFDFPTAPGTSTYLNHDKRALLGFEIYDLSTSRGDGTSLGARVASVGCSTKAQYRVVPSTDSTATFCRVNAPNDSELSNYAAYGMTYDDVKAYDAAVTLLHSFPNGSARWRIDQKNHCIIEVSADPANNKCYDSVKPIQWGTQTADVCGGSSTKQCPHYFSVCFK